MTDTADFDVEYSTVATNPGNPTDNPSNWSNTASADTIWMATRECHNGVWSTWQVSKVKGEKGDAGQNSIQLTLDNEHEDFIYSDSGKVTTSVTSQAHLFDGETEITSGISWTIDQTKSSGVSFSDATAPTISNSGLLTVNGLTADTAKVMVRAEYPASSGKYYYKAFTSNKTSQDKYNLVFSDNAIAYNPATYQTKRIKVYADVTNRVGATSHANISASSGTPVINTLQLWATYGGNSVQITNTVTEGGITKLYLDVTSAIAAANDGIYFELRKYKGSSSYDVVDHETIEIAKVQNGEDSYSIMANPLVIELNTDENGNVLDHNQKQTAINIFKGGSSTAETTTVSSITPAVSNIFNVEGHGNVAYITYKSTAPALTAPTEIAIVATTGSVQRTINVLVVPNKRGAEGNAGADAVYLDLDNENDAIQYNGAKLTASVQSQATLRKGGNPQSVTIEIDANSSTIGSDYRSISNGLITVTDVKDANGANLMAGVVVAKATYGNNTFYRTFTVQRLDNGAPKYWLKIDKPVATGNVSNDTASVTVNVQVWRTAINTTTNQLEDTQVDSLSTYGLKLWRQSNSNTPNNASSSYQSGVYAHTINLKTISDSIQSYTYYITNNIDSWSSEDKKILDRETIPVVKVRNGDQGPKGDATRQPYEWGLWSDFAADTTQTFTANKYEAPYFIVENEVTSGGVTSMKQTKWQWVGADGTYNATQAGTPASDNANWELMVTDFKYLISEAQIADYGKFGSGIFSGDYAFSQYGTGIDAAMNHYKNFRPEFFKGQPYTLFSGSMAIDNTYYDESHMFCFGEIFLEEEVNYRFDLTVPSIGGGMGLRLVDTTDYTRLTQWAITNQGLSQRYTHPDGGTNVLSGRVGRSYLLCGFVLNSNGITTVTKIEVTASKAFRPNIYIDWLKGEIFSQLGRFVNVTIEGVINNLIQEITTEAEAAKYGLVVNPQVNPLSSNTKVLWLNPLLIGSYVRISIQGGISVGLPSAFYHGSNTDSIEDGGLGMSLDEMRQCVGKKIFIMPNFVNLNQNAFFSGSLANLPGASIGMIMPKKEYFSGSGFVTTDDLKNIPQQPMQLNVSKTIDIGRSPYYSHSGATSGYYYILECKLGIYDGHECIYWEIMDGGQSLTR
jgi:hypothetical protein